MHQAPNHFCCTSFTTLAHYSLDRQHLLVAILHIQPDIALYEHGLPFAALSSAASQPEAQYHANSMARSGATLGGWIELGMRIHLQGMTEASACAGLRGQVDGHAHTVSRA